MRTYLTYLGQKGRIAVYIKIDGFFQHLSIHNKVKEAFKLLDLHPYLEELKKINKDYNSMSKERKENIINGPNVDCRLVEREILRILRLFLEQLETYQRAFTDLNFESLFERNKYTDSYIL